MKRPWRRKALDDRLVMSLANDALAYGRSVNGRLVRCGVEARGADSAMAFARRVRLLGLRASHVTAVLPLHECQLLQIDAPAVPYDELKAAARWTIKDMVDTHLDDLTLDVMVVGDGGGQGQRQLFVAAAQTRAIREISDWSQAAGLQLSVIDIRETAQRNLQSALQQRLDRPDSASAALMLQGEQCLLTICARGELFYARRLGWDPAALAGNRDNADSNSPDAAGDRPPQWAMLESVDRGAGPGHGAPGEDAPRLVIELQSSLDLWERSWPDLPLERVLIQVGEHSQALAELLRALTGLPTEVLQPEQVFAGLDKMASTPAARAAVIPLLGALLRTESRQL
jgi:MSHA biogenesis protein MshI